MIKLDNVEKCNVLIKAYRLHDYYCELADKALIMINNAMTGMTLNDIKYCIERTSKK